MEVQRCEETGLHFVVVNGQVFVNRKDVVEAKLSYYPVATLRRVGERHNLSYAEIEWRQQTKTVGVTIS